MAQAVTLGSVAPTQATPAPTVSTAGTATETVHTTANHPWLTADRGWVEAGKLKPGEPVVTLGGATETVAWVQVVAGQADMYNLTVAQDHTYAIGNHQVVVHNVNCFNSPPLSIDDAQFGAKVGKHAADFGLDPADPAARAQIRAMINDIHDIHDNFDEVRQGPWNPKGGGGSDYLFYRQGANVVVTQADGQFVTILQGGETNGWFQRATSVAGP